MYGAAWIPEWPAVSAVVTGRARSDIPVVVCHAHTVIACNGLAEYAGVRHGMRQRIARTIVPDGQFLPADPAFDAQVFHDVVRICERMVVPHIVRPGILFFRADNALRTQNWEELAAHIIGDIVQDIGVEAHFGCGPAAYSAILAALHDAVCHDLCDIDGYPLDDLRLTCATHTAMSEMTACIDVLHQLGLQCLGDIRRLDARAFATRFGKTGAHILDILRGTAALEIGSECSDDLSVWRSFDPPLYSTDQAAFVARDIAEEFVSLLTQRGLIAREVCIALTTDTQLHQRTWVLDTARGRDVAERIRWEVNAWATHNPELISHIRVVATNAVPAGRMQDALWGTPRTHDAEVSRAVARMRSILGSNAVYSVHRHGGRSPGESYRLEEWGIRTQESAPAPWPGALPRPWPTAVADRPYPVVLVDEHFHECCVSGLGTMYCQESCTHAHPAFLLRAQQTIPVTDSVGPWLHNTGWWGKDAQRSAWCQLLLASTKSPEAVLVCRRDQTWWLVGRYT